jgi:endonuclease/exonuclease/phosphatase family metal-dependent hydrolase
MEIKVLTYNIHKGFSSGNRRFVLERIRNALRELAPDLIFLQEVVGVNSLHEKKIEAWPDRAQSEFLAEEFWPYFVYGRNAMYLYGHHGNALIGRYPILQWSNFDISTNPIESRGILHSLIELPNCKVHCFCTHLNVFKRGRTTQVEQLCRYLKESLAPQERFIVAGDFNDWLGHFTRRLHEESGALEAHHSIFGKHGRTFPARLPVLTLDRMYCRGLLPIEARVLSGAPWRDLSDHLPLFVRMRVE